MKKTFFVLGRGLMLAGVIFVLSDLGYCADGGKAIELLVDSSGSMGEKLEGRVKIDIAKEAISSVLSEIPDDIPTGLRAYGHLYTAEEHNCQDSELLVPVKSGTKLEISQKVYSLTPRGYTPIAYALSMVPQDFPSKDAYCYIILVSDGKETCGGNPIATIEALKNQGYKIIVHTVGFSVDEDTRKQLTAIANASGGLYKDAANARELTESLKTITDKIREFKPYQEKEGIEPGNGFSNAPLIEFDKTYAYDIMAGEEHFYKIPVKKGAKVMVTVTMKRKEGGPFWDCNSIQGIRRGLDSDYADPSAFLYSVSLYDPDRMIVDSTNNRDAKESTIGYNATSPQTTRLQGEMPFVGEAFLTIGLNWKFPTPPQASDMPFFQEKFVQEFEGNRKAVKPTAYYTFKVRLLE